jgi:uncharacterized protein (TIGR00730 family)
MVEQIKVPRPRRRYRTGNDTLDAKIAEVIAESGLTADADLLTEMLTSCFRLAKHRTDRGEMKLVNAALKEFVYSFRVFKEYRGYRKVSIFGSARSTGEDPNYEHTRSFAKMMAEEGWMVITGAGPGIMAAGHEGAGADLSFGAAIRLPMESEANEFIGGNPKLINFKYFFTRKVTFLKESDAFVMLPGGFGTLDEAYELLTLMQTGKTDIHPVVLLEVPGGTYWEEWLRFTNEQLASRGLISPGDLALVRCTHDIGEAVTEITRFYSNYHSMRYVDGRLVLRMKRLPPDDILEKLASAYSGILRKPRLEPVQPSAQEAADNDALDCVRLALDFRRDDFGRLRLLIDELNRY